MNCPECRAELPPDWCGHEAIVEDMTTAYMVGEQKGRAPLEAEIDRLRKIEAAARAHIAWEYRIPGARRFTMTDLRTALAEEPDR